MSVELVLVPLAFAAVSAWQASRKKADEQGRTVQHVQTRMRDASLLAAALEDTEAQVSNTPVGIAAAWQGVRGDFRRDDQGIWQVDFTGDVDERRAGDIVAAIDQAYGLQVQQAVLARLRERAPAAGMTIESETVDADDNVTLVLAVERGSV